MKMTPEKIKSIRHDYGMTCDEMAAVLRLEGAHRARKVREWEAGTRQLTGPVSLIYDILDDGTFPDFVFGDLDSDV